MTTRLVNLTNRYLTVYDEAGETVLGRLPPDGRVVSVSILPEEDRRLPLGDAEVPVVGYAYANVDGLPGPDEDVVYVVSYAVLQALDEVRVDVIAPDTSPTSVVRDPATGRVAGVRRFRVL